MSNLNDFIPGITTSTATLVTTEPTSNNFTWPATTILTIPSASFNILKMKVHGTVSQGTVEYYCDAIVGTDGTYVDLSQLNKMEVRALPMNNIWPEYMPDLEAVISGSNVLVKTIEGSTSTSTGILTTITFEIKTEVLY